MNVVAVDVGTTSVRLAIISFRGEGNKKANVLASCNRDITLRQDGVKFEQSSIEIWRAICECSRECLDKSGVASNSIVSIAFSATCSLVIQGDSTDDFDIIMWMDHRALEEAQKITDQKSQVISQFGGVCSPEFSLSKLIWLKKHDPERFNSSVGFYELPDWLVNKCIESESASSPRSLCSVVCKWGFDAEKYCHCEEILSLNAEEKIGRVVSSPGTISGHLSPKAAIELGLIEECSTQRDKENQKPLNIVVGTSLIDAHSGMLAMLSVPLNSFGIGDLKLESTICSLAGTSSCHMLLTKESDFARGIWGPYKDVILKDHYLFEAGQSLSGKLIEICIESHNEGKSRLESGERMYDIIASLNEQIGPKPSNFKRHLLILPTFHGNRSPLANPRLQGGVYGLTAEEGKRRLIDYYIATLDSLAFETRYIFEHLRHNSNEKLDTILVSGGLMKNSFFMQILADVMQCRVVKMSLADIDFMVMGGALTARHAALSNDSKPLDESSIEGLCFEQLDVNIFQPDRTQLEQHDRRYKCYREFVEFSLRVDHILNPRPMH